MRKKFKALISIIKESEEEVEIDLNGPNPVVNPKAKKVILKELPQR